MASSSDTDDNNSSDGDGDSVFYDASSNLADNEITTPLEQEPRWRISSKNDSSKGPEHFYTISLTENQLQDIERRDKLQRLRAQENNENPNSRNSTVKTPSEPIPIVSSPIIEQESSGDETSTAPDLLKDHIDNEHFRRQKKNSVSSISKQTGINSTPVSNEHQNGLPYVAKSARGTGGYYSNKKSLSSISEPNIVDLNLINRITKFGNTAPYGQKLNDDEILRQPIVRNLDNGKYIPLNDANPMTQTIMERLHSNESIMTLRQTSRKTSLEISNNNLHEMNLSRQKHKTNEDDDNESTSSECSSHTTAMSSSVDSKSSSMRTATSIFSGGKRQLTKLGVKNFFGRGKNKNNSDHHDQVEMDEEEDDGERLPINDGSNGDLKYKASRNLREQAQFDKTQLLQTIVNAHNGPIWCMRFSPDGHLLATGGQDSSLKIWVFKSAEPHFNDFSRITSNLSKQQNEILTNRFNQFHKIMSSEIITPTINTKLGLNEIQAPLYTKPFCELSGHQAPVLDVAWSKSLFLLSSSMDKTVRLWHLSRLECLCFFRHVDFVSAIAFHPRDDRYFVSASLDGHVRLWNIPDKRVIHWALIPAQASSQISAAQANLITAVSFCDDGRKVTVGTFDGRFLLYNDSLQYDTVMNIGDKDGSRSHRSRKKRRRPYKITGIEPMNLNNSKVLITSNDSRIRLYNIRSKEIESKYRGYSNQSSQIRASVSHDDQYIISGSEDSWFYIWKTEPISSLSAAAASLTRKQRHHFERIQVHNTMVTSAIFAPNPVAIMDYLSSSSDCSPSLSRSIPSSAILTPNVNNNRTRLVSLHRTPSPIEKSMPIYVIVSADSKGQLKLLVNRFHR